MCQWRSTRTRTIPSPHRSDVPVEKQPYPYHTEPSRVGCASGEAAVPVPYRALTGRMCQWRSSRTRTIPSPHGSDVPVEKQPYPYHTEPSRHPYPYRTEPSQVGCASGEAPVPVPYRALTGRMCQWRSTRTRTVPSPHGSDVPVEKHPYPYRTEPSRVGCASGEAPVPVPYRALTGRMCQWRSTRTRTVPSPHGSDVPVEKHPYPYRTEPSQVGCASGEAPVPVPYRALTGRMCQWRSTRTRTVPSPHRSDVPVEKHPYPYRTEPSQVGCASGEAPVPVPYRALTGRMCQWRSTRTRTVPSPHRSDVPVEKHPYPYRTEPSQVGCASGEAPVPVPYRALTGRMCQWRSTRTRTVPSPHGSDVPVEKHPYPYRTEPSRVGCASGEAPVPVPYRALTGRMCQWRSTRTRTVPSPHGSDVPVEKHPYPYRTEPSRVGCASGEAPVPVPYRALTGRMCQWRSTRTRTVPSPHGSDVPVEKHPYPYRTEPSRVGCASGEAPVPVPYRALTGRMCQWRSTRTRTVPSPHGSDVPVEKHPYPYRTEPSRVGCASGEAPVPVPYRALTGRMCQWRSTRTRTVPSPHGSDVPVEKHPYPYRTEPSRVGCASGEAPVPVPYRALTGRMCQWRSTRTRTVPSPHGSDVPVEKHPYPYRTEPSRVGCASGEAPVPVPYRALTGRMCQWRSTRTRTVPSPHGSDVPVEKHPYPYRTEPSRVGCASGEAPVPVPYRALTGRMCQWRSTRTRTVPSPHGSDVPVEKHPYPYRTEPSRVGCASGEAPVPVPYRALTGRMCQWRSTRTRTVPSPHGSDVPVEKHPYPYRTEPSRVGCASGEAPVPVPYRALTGHVCQWRSTRTVPSLRGSDVAVEKGRKWRSSSPYSVRTVFPTNTAKGEPAVTEPEHGCASSLGSAVYATALGSVSFQYDGPPYWLRPPSHTAVDSDHAANRAMKATSLYSLNDYKPPISKAKMTQITKLAIKAIKFYKHVVQSVEKFVQKSKIVRVLNLWQKNNVFKSDIIQPLLDMAVGLPPPSLTPVIASTAATVSSNTPGTPVTPATPANIVQGLPDSWASQISNTDTIAAVAQLLQSPQGQQLQQLVQTLQMQQQKPQPSLLQALDAGLVVQLQALTAQLTAAAAAANTLNPLEQRVSFNTRTRTSGCTKSKIKHSTQTLNQRCRENGRPCSSPELSPAAVFNLTDTRSRPAHLLIEVQPSQSLAALPLNQT
ncbi:UNVERIFIED_CONTAM: hypothetical protein FKN15_011099 [Acipenser sinensis]